MSLLAEKTSLAGSEGVRRAPGDTASHDAVTDLDAEVSERRAVLLLVSRGNFGYTPENSDRLTLFDRKLQTRLAPEELTSFKRGSLPNQRILVRQAGDGF